MYSSSICRSSFRTLPVYSVLKKKPHQNVSTSESHQHYATVHRHGMVPKVILDIEGDPHVSGLPLYVELVAGLQAEWERIMEGNYDLLYYNRRKKWKISHNEYPKLGPYCYF